MELYGRVAYGEEGVNYEWDEDGLLIQKPGFGTGEERTNQGWQYFTMWNTITPGHLALSAAALAHHSAHHRHRRPEARQRVRSPVGRGVARRRQPAHARWRASSSSAPSSARPTSPPTGTPTWTSGPAAAATGSPKKPTASGRTRCNHRALRSKTPRAALRFGAYLFRCAGGFSGGLRGLRGLRGGQGGAASGGHGSGVARPVAGGLARLRPAQDPGHRRYRGACRALHRHAHRVADLPAGARQKDDTLAGR